MKPGAHGDDETGPFAKTDAAYRRRQFPRASFAGGRLPAIDPAVRNIDPIERRFALRPERRFAGGVARIDDALHRDLQACAHALAPPSRSCCEKPRMPIVLRRL